MVVYAIRWESSFSFKCLLPGIHHKVGEFLCSFDFRCSALINGGSLVDYTEPPFVRTGIYLCSGIARARERECLGSRGSGVGVPTRLVMLDSAGRDICMNGIGS